MIVGGESWGEERDGATDKSTKEGEGDGCLPKLGSWGLRRQCASKGKGRAAPVWPRLSWVEESRSDPRLGGIKVGDGKCLVWDCKSRIKGRRI